MSLFMRIFCEVAGSPATIRRDDIEVVAGQSRGPDDWAKGSS
ncbi:hypothetical protein [Scleromatobacter humisilvae]|nr:hypothetical protein [Scleromatobacter humisilvae]